jgi:hypothetical protein
MKINLLFAFSLLVCQFSFSQAGKTLNGTVSSNSFLLQHVDVINKTSKASTTTNAKGEFTITAKANDSLYFYAKGYYMQRLKLTSEQIDQNNLIVHMFKKPEELEEVVVTKMKSIKLSNDKGYEQGKLDQLTIDKNARKLKTGVYDGTIENGSDIMRIGGMIIGLFIKDKEPSKEKIPEIEFATLAKKTCNQKFYLEKLKLKPDEIDLFLQFCDADPQSKILIEHSNILSMMDFLSAKNIEFKNLPSSK